MARTAPDGTEQLTFHQRGRSSDTRAALRQDVLDTYRFLSQNYVPGDELYVVGFSRGAYVARTIVGICTGYGIVRPEHADRVEDAYALYRSRSLRVSPRSFPATDFRHSYAHEITVRFLGVWETVGPLGIPARTPRALDLRWRTMMFHDTALSDRVKAAFQALAIDEHRPAYAPALWRSSGSIGKHIEQLWFPGTHGDVGGGHVTRGASSLANITLRWMIEKARDHGLAFRQELVQELAGDPLDVLHDSLSAVHRLRRPLLRRIGIISPDTEAIASTAEQRLQAVDGYRPRNLPVTRTG